MELLKQFENKVELNVRGTWKNMGKIYKEIDMAHVELQKIRAEIEKLPDGEKRNQKIKNKTMEKLNYKGEVILWAFLLLPLVYLAYVWSALPSIVPIHFDARGEANGWGGKATELILPGVIIFIYFFIKSEAILETRTTATGDINTQL